MHRFRLLFVLFALALLGPVALLVQRALHSVALESQMRHQALAERVFDEMERAVSRLLEGEEERPFEGYAADAQGALSDAVDGRFEIDPDGSIRAQPADIEQVVATSLRGGPIARPDKPQDETQLPGTTVDVRRGDVAPAPPVAGAPAPRAGGELAYDAFRSLNKAVVEREERQRKVAQLGRKDDSSRDAAALAEPPPDRLEDAVQEGAADLPPMIGRVVDARHLILYRTVVRGGRAYQQGVVLDLERLAAWLRAQALGDDGLVEYTEVAFWTPLDAGRAQPSAEPFTYRHRFAEPFDGVTAEMTLRPLSGLGSVTYVYALSGLVVATAILGLGALYRMVSVVVSYAERRSNFAAAVSHELKTPLTAIRMYGEMLRDGMVPTEAKRHEYYRHITAESERLSRLINNVLEFARLEKGRRDVSLATGSLAPVVREAAELLRPHAEREGFELRVEIDEHLPPARFERDALMQVLSNLVDNAVKYAGTAPLKRIEIACRRAGDGVVITVRDHGSGVSARHLGKIFQPFYRGENELTRRSKGTGLGLALVRGIAERMGAKVAGRNAPEGGFEVEVAFAPVIGQKPQMNTDGPSAGVARSPMK